MALTKVIAIGNGVTRNFAVNFALGYISKDHIVCQVAGEVDGTGAPLYRNITFLSDNLVSIDGTVPAVGALVEFTRTVPKSTLVVDYADGDTLNEDNLDSSQKQSLMAVQEVIDGRIKPVVNIDLNGYLIKNSGAPKDANDLVNKAWLDLINGQNLALYAADYAAIKTSITSGILAPLLNFSNVPTRIVSTIQPDALAIGYNSGAVLAGFQIGGGSVRDGSHGVINRLEGHATWQGLFPSRDLQTIELAVHPTSTCGEAKATAGTNELTYIQGRPWAPSWIGRKIWFNYGEYRVKAVNGNKLQVNDASGNAYVFPADATEVYFFGYILGAGYASISGNKLNRREGDPFVPYVTEGSLDFYINGVRTPLVGFTNDQQLVLGSAPGDNPNVYYEFYLDINNQLATFRIHATDQDAENVSLYRRYDGAWLECQYGSFGRYRPLRLSTGEIRYAPGLKNQQIVMWPNGDVTLGGDYTRDTIRIPALTAPRANFIVAQAAPTGAGPSLQARGSDDNVDWNFDTKGYGNFGFSSNTFAQRLFEIEGTTATGGSWLKASSGLYPTLTAQGPATNISMTIKPKGTGQVKIERTVLSLGVGVPQTPADPGAVVFEFTNNTTLTIRARGTDNVVRNATINLA